MTVNVQNRMYTIAADGKLAAQYLNGDHKLSMELRLPDVKKMLLNMSLSNVYQPRELSNRLDIDGQWPTGNYQMSLSNVVKDLDRAMYTYSAITELVVKSDNIEEVKMRMDSKRIVRGDKRNVDFKVSQLVFLI